MVTISVHANDSDVEIDALRFLHNNGAPYIRAIIRQEGIHSSALFLSPENARLLITQLEHALASIPSAHSLAVL